MSSATIRGGLVRTEPPPTVFSLVKRCFIGEADWMMTSIERGGKVSGVALATGASSGIGGAMVSRLLGDGCAVVDFALDPAGPDRLAMEVGEGSPRVIAGKVTDSSGILRAGCACAEVRANQR